MSDELKAAILVRIPVALAERMRADAKYRGQAITVWLTRAVTSAVERGEAEQREYAPKPKRRARTA